MAIATRPKEWKRVPDEVVLNCLRDGLTIHVAKRGYSSSRQLTTVPEFSGFLAEEAFAEEFGLPVAHRSLTGAGDAGWDYWYKQQKIDVKAGPVREGGFLPDLLLFPEDSVVTDAYALVAVSLPDIPIEMIEEAVEKRVYYAATRMQMLVSARWTRTTNEIRMVTGRRIAIGPKQARAADRPDAVYYPEGNNLRAVVPNDGRPIPRFDRRIRRQVTYGQAD